MSDISHAVFPRELKYGIPVLDEEGNRLGESAKAAQQAIAQVVVSRIGMAVPAMGKCTLPWLTGPGQCPQLATSVGCN